MKLIERFKRKVGRRGSDQWNTDDAVVHGAQARSCMTLCGLRMPEDHKRGQVQHGEGSKKDINCKHCIKQMWRYNDDGTLSKYGWAKLPMGKAD